MIWNQKTTVFYKPVTQEVPNSSILGNFQSIEAFGALSRFDPWETNIVTTWRLSPLYLDFFFSSRIFVQLIQNVQSYTHCCSERRIVIVIVTHNIGNDHGLHSLSNVTLSPSNLVTTALLLFFWRSRHSWSNKLLRFCCEEQRPLNIWFLSR